MNKKRHKTFKNGYSKKKIENDQQKLQGLVDRVIIQNKTEFVWDETILTEWENINNKGCRLSQFMSVDVMGKTSESSKSKLSDFE